MITHAGSVVYRQNRGETLYLVISSSDGAHWVLPKGHIKSGESPEAAALRELREEAGVVGEIKDRLQIQSFEIPRERIAVQYYLVKALGYCPPDEKRVIRWEDQKAALDLLSFENSRKVLIEGIAASPIFSPV